MKDVLWFSEIDKNYVPEVGGKGANLGEMYNAGFPVPPGFVVTAGAYLKHIKHNNLEEKIRHYLNGLDVNDTDKLYATSNKIQRLILEGDIPKDVEEQISAAYVELCKKIGRKVYVAVRSSATAEDLPGASFAGQQETYVNIIGKDNVVQAAKKCWASLFTPRAIFYRVQEGFDHMKVRLAAVVQLMVNSEQSGVVFTVDPVYQDPDIITIECGYGLGDAIVAGEITPDTYRVSKKKGEIIDKIISKQTWMYVRSEHEHAKAEVPKEIQEKQKLPDSDILALAKICKEIEEHYGYPQDIEYAVENGNIYIVQARPITTLKRSDVNENFTISKAPDTSGEDVQSVKNVSGISKAEDVMEEKKEVLVQGLGASPGVGIGKAVIIHDKSEISKIKKGDVLITKMTTPDFVPAMKRAVAIVTDEGGMTSHAAIVSRELGVPCVVGTENATSVIKPGEIISVDGTHGVVYKGSVGYEGEREEEAKSEKASIGEEWVSTGTKIYVNLAEVELAEKVAKLPVDGVGLLRAEFMIADIGKHPKKIIEEGKGEEFTNKLAEKLRRFAAAFYPRPVVYRATDFKTNEYRNLEGGEEFEPEEANPMMGYRGAARYIKEPEVFKLELNAIKIVREKYKLRNLWLMIPFVRRIGELRAIREIMQSVGLYRTRDFKLWIMVEVPSTVFLIDKFCEEGIDGVSIGSNDLTQLTLGIDRDNATLAREFDERNAAVLRAIKHVITVASRYGVTVSLCGQAPSVYPSFAEKLVEYGITSMSVNPDAVMRTRRIVASAEQKILLKRTRHILSRLRDLED